MKTVTEVASELGITTGRVRQLCIKHGIGHRLGPLRFFTAADLRRLASVRKRPGRPKKLSENSPAA